MLLKHLFLILLVPGVATHLAAASSEMRPEPATSNPLLTYYNPALIRSQPQTVDTDVCIYGGSAAGVIAAYQLKRLGREVVILEPGGHLGGLSSGGLSFTDIGNKAAIGGLAREFYRRVGEKYGEPEEWRFEPRVAEQVFNELVEEAEVPVFYRQFLQSVQKTGATLQSMTTMSRLTVRARVFVDATYEGDLMAHAAVNHHIGRESNHSYGETLNGIQLRDKHQFEFPVDPYVVEGDPLSGLLPGINPEGPGEIGDGDHRLQAYNFRLCLSKEPATRVPFPKPAGYNPDYYILLARYLKTGWSNIFGGFGPLRNGKMDLNNNGAVSTDFIGMNYDYPSTHYVERERIFQEHVRYQQGLLWFLANDPQVPETVRARANEWGLASDEFVETDGWPHQLYVREARRMISDYVMTEHNCRGSKVAADPVALAAYTMDSHNCQRFARDDQVWNEGDVQVGGFSPYPISYRSIVPKKSECINLLVPVCLSTTHIAYGSIRMEPVFMILGQSAATAADLAMDRGLALQDVPYSDLRQRLLDDGQVLEWVPPVAAAPAPDTPPAQPPNPAPPAPAPAGAPPARIPGGP